MHHPAPVQPPAPAPMGPSTRSRWNRPPAQLALLPDQSVVRIRTAVPADLDAVQDLHRRCSPATGHARYHAGKSRLTEADWAHLNNAHRAVCWLVTERGRPERVIAMANFVRHATEPAVADLAVLVEDSWQRRGVGGELLRLALRHAERHRLEQVTATITATARRVRAVLLAHGFRVVDVAGATEAMALELPRTAPVQGAAR